MDTEKNNFCIAPWVNLHVDTTEHVKPCCRGAGISIPITDIDSYTHSTDKNVLDLKQKLLKNQLPLGCVGCQERNWYSEFSNIRVDSESTLTLHSLDFRWSNTCQLNCMYCNENWSSSWAALKQNSETYRVKNNKHKLFELVNSQKNQIKRVSLLGGEPLLMKENIEVLDMLPNDVGIDIFTNLNVDIENNLIFSRLIERSNVNWYISMENIGNKFEFVRRNSCWKQQVINIELLLKRSQSKFTPTIQSQFCVYSATSISELYQWANNYNLKINWNWLQNPAPLDFKNFSDSYKMMSLDQISQVKNIKSNYLPDLDLVITQLESSLGQGGQEYVEKCKKWHQVQESVFFNNRLNFKKLWPEFL